jgi:hypothetical protein
VNCRDIFMSTTPLQILRLIEHDRSHRDRSILAKRVVKKSNRHGKSCQPRRGGDRGFCAYERAPDEREGEDFGPRFREPKPEGGSLDPDADGLT